MTTYLAVEDVVIAITLDGHLDVGSITRGDLRFCHQERRSNLAVQQRVKPLPLLCLGTVLSKHLHVARIWSSAVGSLSAVSMKSIFRVVQTYLRSYPALAQVLGHDAVLQVAEASTLFEMCLGQEHVPQPKLAGPLLHIFNDGWMRREALFCGLANLAEVYLVGGDAFFFDELLNLIDELVGVQRRDEHARHTISSVFAALSLRKGRAMTGTRSEAGMWPLAALFKRL